MIRAESLTERTSNGCRHSGPELDLQGDLTSGPEFSPIRGGARANIALPKFRGSMGDPLLLENVLARHHRLRIWIMHAGYPMIDNLLTLLRANSHVYVDVAGLIWSYPLTEVNRYIQRIVEAGFEDRVMFGTDQMYWPPTDGDFDQRNAKCRLPDPAAKARHTLQQCRAFSSP